MTTWAGSTYKGSVKNGWYSGEGVYEFANGTRYEGQFVRGEFHGKGVLIYGNGGKYSGTFHRGTAVQGQYKFADGLSYTDRNWSYLSQADRRFYSETSGGLNPAGRTKLTDNDAIPPVPFQMYDTGEGFFDAETKILYDYSLKPTQTTLSKEEIAWVLTHCRKGFDKAPEKVN